MIELIRIWCLGAKILIELIAVNLYGAGSTTMPLIRGLFTLELKVTSSDSSETFTLNVGGKGLEM